MPQGIQVKDLNIFYGDFRAVADVDMEIESNSVTALIGRRAAASRRSWHLNRMHEVILVRASRGMSIGDVDLYGRASTRSRCAARWHGLPESQPVPDDVDRDNVLRAP